EGHTVVQHHVVTDFGGFADYYAHPVIDEETSTDLCPRMDFDTRQGAVELRWETCWSLELLCIPHFVCQTVHPNRMKARITGDDLKCAACGRVTVFGGLNVLAEAAEESHCIPFQKN